MSSISKFGSEAKFPNGISSLVIPFDILMVGGGAGGGEIDRTFKRRAGGGGGGGSVVEIHNLPLTKNTEYELEAGNGGSAGTTSILPDTGRDSFLYVSTLVPGLSFDYSFIKAYGGGIPASFLSSIGLVSSQSKSTGGGGGGGSFGNSTNNAVFIDAADGASASRKPKTSHVLNSLGSITTIVTSAYEGGNAFPYYQQPNNASFDGFCGGGGGGAGSPGRDGLIDYSILGGNAGSPYIPKWITRYNGNDILLGSGGGGGNEYEGASRVPPLAYPFFDDPGFRDFRCISFLDGQGAGGTSTSGSLPSGPEDGYEGAVYLSYPTSYGALQSTTGIDSPDTTSRPGYFIYKTTTGFTGAESFITPA